MVTEIILIAIIIVITFGLGKLPQIASALGRMRVNFKRAASPNAIDITPSKPGEGAGGRKPGKFEDKIEDARVDS